MRKTYFLILLTALVVGAMGCSKDKEPERLGQWRQLSGFPDNTEPSIRNKAVCLSQGDTVYYGLGDGGINFRLKDFSMFTSGKWKSLASYPGRPRVNALGFVANGKVYVGLGYEQMLQTELYRDMWVYDPVTEKWDSVEYIYPGTDRFEAVAFGLNGKGYIGTGYSVEKGEALGDFYEFDPGSGWKELPKAQLEAQRNARVFVVNQNVYLCFGQGAKSGGQREMLRFVPEEGRWQQEKVFRPAYYPQVARTAPVVFVLKEQEGEFVYVMGGSLLEESATDSDWTCCRYDPRRDKWEPLNAPEGIKWENEMVALPGEVGAYLWNQWGVYWSFIP